jgi:D-alanyl-D-alanine carboxypeptidase/D-alanyl-D-alanine-endopeptidase (penicillin-binding protein 4)
MARAAFLVLVAFVAAPTAGAASLRKRLAQDLNASGPASGTGSGAFPFARATPRRLVKLLVGLRRLPTFRALRDSLPIAGRDGTLADRMRSGPGRDRCRAKTGSHFSPDPADQASVLSGYCRTRRGHLVAFSLMMKAVPDVAAARRLQDRMVQASAR